MITKDQAEEFFAAAARAIAYLMDHPAHIPTVDEVDCVELALHELASEWHNEFWPEAEAVARSKRT